MDVYTCRRLSDKERSYLLELSDAFSLLNERQKEALKRHYGGETARQISSSMDVGSQSVRRDISRAHYKLKLLLSRIGSSRGPWPDWILLCAPFGKHLREAERLANVPASVYGEKSISDAFLAC
jgi:hypothetical protein